MRLLVTRSQPDAARSAKALRARGHTPLVAPLMKVEAIEADFADHYAGVLMTSANAARAVAQHAQLAKLTALPLLTVGSRTAEAAREAGFGRTESAEGALPELAALIRTRFDRGARLLYLAGEHLAGDLAGDLGSDGILVETVTVYRAVSVAALPARAAEALADGTLDGALHYSRRSALNLLRLCGEADVLRPLVGLRHYCLSEEVAVPLREAGVAWVSVAPHPDEAALLGLLAD